MKHQLNFQCEIHNNWQLVKCWRVGGVEPHRAVWLLWAWFWHRMGDPTVKGVVERREVSVGVEGIRGGVWTTSSTCNWI